jgi:hypothetical protein
MTTENIETSVIVTPNVQRINNDQFKMPTWGLLVVLIISFLILKGFIYIKDEKRHGQ